jgi:hypothetical protein
MLRLGPGNATVRLKPDATYDRRQVHHSTSRLCGPPSPAFGALRRDNFRLHSGAEVGAGNGIRTRDFDLGKVALYH